MQHLTASDVGVEDHKFLSEVLEAACCYDQLNAGELLSLEMVARRYQLWEEMYATSLRQGVSGGDVAPWVDECTLFLGEDKGQGAALVSPDLEQWVAAEMQKESAVLKERRKAREERTMHQTEQEAGGAEGSKKNRRGGGRGKG